MEKKLFGIYNVNELLSTLIHLSRCNKYVTHTHRHTHKISSIADYNRIRKCINLNKFHQNMFCNFIFTTSLHYYMTTPRILEKNSQHKRTNAMKMKRKNNSSDVSFFIKRTKCNDRHSLTQVTTTEHNAQHSHTPSFCSRFSWYIIPKTPRN